MCCGRLANGESLENAYVWLHAVVSIRAFSFYFCCYTALLASTRSMFSSRETKEHITYSFVNVPWRVGQAVTPSLNLIPWLPSLQFSGSMVRPFATPRPGKFPLYDFRMGSPVHPSRNTARYPVIRQHLKSRKKH